MGRQVTHGIPVLEIPVGSTDTTLQIPGNDQESELYNQCNRVTHLFSPEGDQEPTELPVCRCSDETGVHGIAEHLAQVDHATPGLGLSPESTHNSL